ncbi:high mobility group protein 20A [Frankliniella occidentalis]|uniref:High mobility group protein 20A n=1 Tax=Frankliniella occidentalis TaxID=133901 RepID=A0A6J1SLC3_FRAOC|nr:high mobility group protein 20A [Frankliniella occidentalis]
MADAPKPVSLSPDDNTATINNTVNCEVNLPKPNKSKKKKNKLGVAAPRPPLTGYVRYLNSRRDNLRNDNPNLTFPDITKILAQEWANLPPEEKRPYQEAGEQDRERYNHEFEEYKKTDAYREYLRQQEENKQKGKEKLKDKEPELKRAKIVPEHNDESNSSGFDIPIFTEEFLDLNKSREAELRQLRKSSTDFELQNASLSRIVESMRTAVSNLESDISTQRSNNLALSRHLDQLRASLAAAFHAVALPDANERPTVDNIDSYMQKLHGLFMGSVGNQHAQLLARVSGIVERLDLHG